MTDKREPKRIPEDVLKMQDQMRQSWQTVHRNTSEITPVTEREAALMQQFLVDFFEQFNRAAHFLSLREVFSPIGKGNTLLISLMGDLGTLFEIQMDDWRFNQQQDREYSRPDGTIFKAQRFALEIDVDNPLVSNLVEKVAQTLVIGDMLEHFSDPHTLKKVIDKQGDTYGEEAIMKTRRQDNDRKMGALPMGDNPELSQPATRMHDFISAAEALDFRNIKIKLFLVWNSKASVPSALNISVSSKEGGKKKESDIQFVFGESEAPVPNIDLPVKIASHSTTETVSEDICIQLFPSPKNPDVTLYNTFRRLPRTLTLNQGQYSVWANIPTWRGELNDGDVDPSKTW